MTPKYGDVLIRGDLIGGFEVVDALTKKRLSNQQCSRLEEALVIARLNGGRIWQQRVDQRGRALGDPVPLTSVG